MSSKTSECASPRRACGAVLTTSLDKPLVIAGPCLAESYELLGQVAQSLLDLRAQHDFTLIFKASFDKANRSSASSARGPGLRKFLTWIADLQEKFSLQVITDVHETSQVAAVAEVCDALQIPAFLCRQTDLVLAALASGRLVNIKKGQFMSPWAMKLLATSIQQRAETNNFLLTERGSSFGYGRLVVDMSALQVMAGSGLPIIYDVTHSVQCPPADERSTTSRGDRYLAPALARAAAASGYVSGFFLEVHPDPAHAHSDAELQLSLSQAAQLVPQLLQLQHEARAMTAIDQQYV